MSYLPREMICERLRICQRASYRLVPPSYSSFISSSEVLDLLNASRRGIREPLPCIPSDLRRPEEMAAELGTIPERKLMAWTRRWKNPCPHFRLNKLTTRFSARLVREWLDENSKPGRVRA